MRLKSELWKSVGIFRGVDFTGYYEVSTFGRVRSLDRYVNTPSGRRLCHGAILNLHPSKRGVAKGYVTVHLRRDGVVIETGLHRLVATVFIPNPSNLPEVNHKDENPSNNRVDNLEWCTRLYNVNYGSHNQKIANSKKIPVVQLNYNGEIVKIWDCAKDADKCGYQDSKISDCMKNKRKVHGNSVWIYKRDYDKMTHDEVRLYCKQMEETQDNRIVQLTLEHEFIRVWQCAKDAIVELGLNANIYHCLTGHWKQYKGFIWMKYKDYKEKIGE